MTTDATQAAIDTEALVEKYGNLKVPQLTMIMMGVIIVALIAVIIIGFVYIHRHFPDYANAIFIGVLSELIFGYLIYGGSTFLLSKVDAVNTFMTNHETAYNAILVILSVILDSLAVILGMKYLFKYNEKRNVRTNIGAAFTFGLAMYTAAIMTGQQLTFAFEYIMYGTMMNNLGLDTAIYQMMVNGVTEKDAVDSVNALINTSWLKFLWEGCSYVLKALVKTCAAVIMYGIYKEKLERKLLYAGIGMIAAYFIPTLLNLLLKAPGALCIVLTVLITIGAVVLTAVLIHKHMPEDEEDIKRKPLKKKHYTDNSQQKMPKIVMPDD